MAAEDRVDSLKAKVFRAVRRELKPFGWETHRFDLLPPVSEQELAQFENRHGITLPSEYRTFLLRVSRGGAGPGHGLIRFENAFPIELAAPSSPFLATAFPFAAGTPPPAPHSDENSDERDERRLHELSGTLRVCDEGCGYLHFLVCTGEDRGQIWIDSTSDVTPYRRLGVGFFDWYEHWLDNILGGRDGCWWLEANVDAEFRGSLERVKPWWRR